MDDESLRWEYRRPVRTGRAEARPVERSNAAIPVAVVVVGLGLYLGTYSILAPVALGLVLLASAASLLSSRINPLSAHFYLTRKPSWAAVGVVVLGACVLLGYAYELWRQAGLGRLLPHG